MKTFKPWLVIALVFVAGFAAGAVVARGVVRHVVQQVAENPNRLRLLIERRITRQLRLDLQQRRKVDDILTDTQRELQALRREFAPEVITIISNAESQISATLTPEQRERFEKFREENHRLWPPR